MALVHLAQNTPLPLQVLLRLSPTHVRWHKAVLLASWVLDAQGGIVPIFLRYEMDIWAGAFSRTRNVS